MQHQLNVAQFLKATSPSTSLPLERSQCWEQMEALLENNSTHQKHLAQHINPPLTLPCSHYFCPVMLSMS